MGEYDATLSYVASDDVITLIPATNILAAVMIALEDAVLFKDLKYITRMDIRPNDDKKKLCS